MHPIDLLSKDELHDIDHYFQLSAGRDDLLPVVELLADWNKNKKTLCKALGNKLRVEVPIDSTLFNDSTEVIAQDLRKVYNAYLIDAYEYEDYAGMSISQLLDIFLNSFLAKFFYSILPLVSPDEIFDVCCLFRYRQIAEQSMETSKEFHINGQEIKVHQGCKPIKAIRKLIMALDKPTQDYLLPSFTEWCNEISNIRTRNTHPQSIVISIHPMDILTASDNNCGWTSCLDFRRPGAYRAGILEYLGSNNNLIIYAKHSRDMLIPGMRQPVPNKFWRAFAVVDKHIAIIGKSYPFHSKLVDDAALSAIEDLVQKNLKWTYQYKHEQYKDAINFDDYYRGFYRNIDKHRIFLISHGLVYNDFNNNVTYPFVCSRNYVPETLNISIGSTAHCVVCGEPLSEDDSGEASEIVCYDCNSYVACEICDCHCAEEDMYRLPVYDDRVNQVIWFDLCESCAEDDLYWDIEAGYFIRRRNFNPERKYLDFCEAYNGGYI